MKQKNRVQTVKAIVDVLFKYAINYEFQETEYNLYLSINESVSSAVLKELANAAPFIVSCQVRNIFGANPERRHEIVLDFDLSEVTDDPQGSPSITNEGGN